MFVQPYNCEMRLRLGVFLSLLHFSFIYATLPPISVNPTTNQLVDNLGRSRLFHGVNVIAKSPPYYPTDLLSPERIQLLSSLGFNAVRLVNIYHILLSQTRILTPK